MKIQFGELVRVGIFQAFNSMANVNISLFLFDFSRSLSQFKNFSSILLNLRKDYLFLFWKQNSVTCSDILFRWNNHYDFVCFFPKFVETIHIAKPLIGLKEVFCKHLVRWLICLRESNNNAYTILALIKIDCCVSRCHFYSLNLVWIFCVPVAFQFECQLYLDIFITLTAKQWFIYIANGIGMRNNTLKLWEINQDEGSAYVIS